MDYNKIGSFIASERKKLKLTQEKLANKLFVSAKLVSKWEKGNGIPDTNLLPKLCEIFGISLNELLNGERFSKDNYISKAEEKLLEVKKEKEQTDKRLLAMEIVSSVYSLFLMFSLILTTSFVEMPSWIKVVLIVFAFVQFLVAMFIAIRIEQKTGLYECQKCHHKYVPTFGQVLCAMHVNRTRYLKCPHCGKRSWNKKVIK